MSLCTVTVNGSSAGAARQVAPGFAGFPFGPMHESFTAEISSFEAGFGQSWGASTGDGTAEVVANWVGEELEAPSEEVPFPPHEVPTRLMRPMTTTVLLPKRDPPSDRM